MVALRSSARLTAALVAAALLAAPLAGCGASDGPDSSPTSSQEGTAMDLQTVYDAVIASDPRVEDPLGTVSYSGAAKTLSLSVLISGDEPVSTETLTAILVAVRDTTPDDIETVGLVAREAAHEERIVDLRSTIAGLPEDTTPLWDGGLTMSRVDLDKLGA